MNKFSSKLEYLVTGGLVATTLLSGAILSSIKVKADTSAIDNVSVTVPISCSLSATVDTEHTATLNNGIYSVASTDYANGIGKTTLTTFCNDEEGFAIYAIGYTNEEEGNNTLVGTNTGNTIDTAVYTSGDTVSSWAMKLNSVSGTYAPIIAGSSADTEAEEGDTDFSTYSAVPDEWTKVAYKTSGTDIAADGYTATGAKLETTYAAYISQTQAADTYEGKVKYTLVHPNDVDSPIRSDQIAVNYDGNGLTFASGAATNRVVYGESCTTESAYVGDTATISKTPNINDDGTYSSVASENGYTDTVTIEGADRLMVMLTYNIDSTGGGGDVLSLMSTKSSSSSNDNAYVEVYDNDNHTYGTYGLSGVDTIYVDGDTVNFYVEIYGSIIEGYDYGYYALIYPIYEEETEGATYRELSEVCALASRTGAYAETITWNGKWYLTANGDTTTFADESAVKTYLANNSETLLGTTVTLYAYNPYAIYYDGNNATAGTMSGFYTTIETMSDTADLMVYNFYKTGYGFAGWSENSSATVNSSDKIYGPNEKITGSDLTFNSSTHETTLYAVWVPTSGMMQSWSGCSSLSIGDVTALTDSRDSNVYTVGKLADGNCWMMENLRLDAENSTDSSLAQGFGGAFTGLADSEDANFTNSTTANSLYSTSTITGSYHGYRFPRYNNNNTNIGGTNSAGTSLTVSPGVWDPTHWDNDQYNEGNNDHSQWYGYGNYYTWAAAMANTTSITTKVTSDAAGTSICPTGWRLPSGGSMAAEFGALDIALGGIGSYQSDSNGKEIVSNRWRVFPNNFLYSGNFNGSSAGNRGTRGYYWSRSANTSYLAYSLYLNSSYLSPSNYDPKNFGFPVRCLIGS